jgi:hypothetical protein
MARLPASTPAQPVNVHSSPGVIGLDAAREAVRKQHRRRRRGNRIITTLVALVVVAAAAGAGWFGYGFFTEEQTGDRIETEQRQAELDGQGGTLRDAIDELEDKPAWNGPGNPTFGVGDGDGDGDG